MQQRRAFNEQEIKDLIASINPESSFSETLNTVTNTALALISTDGQGWSLKLPSLRFTKEEAAGLAILVGLGSVFLANNASLEKTLASLSKAYSLTVICAITFALLDDISMASYEKSKNAVKMALGLSAIYAHATNDERLCAAIMFLCSSASIIYNLNNGYQWARSLFVEQDNTRRLQAIHAPVVNQAPRCFNPSA